VVCYPLSWCLIGGVGVLTHRCVSIGYVCGCALLSDLCAPTHLFFLWQFSYVQSHVTCMSEMLGTTSNSCHCNNSCGARMVVHIIGIPQYLAHGITLSCAYPFSCNCFCKRAHVHNCPISPDQKQGSLSHGRVLDYHIVV